MVESREILVTAFYKIVSLLDFNVFRLAFLVSLIVFNLISLFEMVTMNMEMYSVPCKFYEMPWRSWLKDHLHISTHNKIKGFL